MSSSMRSIQMTSLCNNTEIGKIPEKLGFIIFSQRCSLKLGQTQEAEREWGGQVGGLQSHSGSEQAHGHQPRVTGITREEGERSAEVGKEQRLKFSLSDSSGPHGLKPARLLDPWDSSGKKTGVGCQFLLQAIIPSQGLNWVSYTAGRFFSHQGSPYWPSRKMLMTRPGPGQPQLTLEFACLVRGGTHCCFRTAPTFLHLPATSPHSQPALKISETKPKQKSGISNFRISIAQTYWLFMKEFDIMIPDVLLEISVKKTWADNPTVKKKISCSIYQGNA